MKPQDLACFENVASVIGKDDAEVELQKVIDLEMENLLSDEPDLMGAFYWMDTPQGHEFWYDINKQIVRKEK